jgi:hypothetical protein
VDTPQGNLLLKNNFLVSKFAPQQMPRTATGAPLGWHVLKLWRCVAPPPPRDAMFLSLAGEQGAGAARGGGSPTCRPATGSLTAFVGLIVTNPPR